MQRIHLTPGASPSCRSDGMQHPIRLALALLLLLAASLAFSAAQPPTPSPSTLLWVALEAPHPTGEDPSPPFAESMTQHLQAKASQLGIHTTVGIPAADTAIARQKWNAVVLHGDGDRASLTPTQLATLEHWQKAGTSFALLGTAYAQLEQEASLPDGLKTGLLPSPDPSASSGLGGHHLSQTGQRTFTFTGSPLREHLETDADRALLLNGLLWVVGVEVPGYPLPESAAPSVRYPTIEEAIARGDADDVRLHLQIDPSRLDQPGRGGYTPLHLAVLRQQAAIVAVLIDAGCNIDALTTSNETALHLAVRRNADSLVCTLMDAGADATVRDRVGWTPLHHAAADSKVECLKGLLQVPATISVISAAGGTALHEAAATGNAATVQLLLDSGVDVTHRANNGKTARDIAIEFENQEALSVLNRKGSVEQ